MPDLTIAKDLFNTINITPVNKTLMLNDYSDANNLVEITASERFTAALQVLLKMISASDKNYRIDRALLDKYISQIDNLLSEQLDEILHHEEFQKLESIWRSLQYLVNRTDFAANNKIELLDVDKETLIDDFDSAGDPIQSGLYHHVYTQEYDMPGGEPISAIISDYEFDASNRDISLLSNLSHVAAAAHSPFIGNVSQKFFEKVDINEVMKIDDISSYMQKAEFIRWNSFRETEDARYVGLCFPRFLLRLPYGVDNPVRDFYYQEQVDAVYHQKFLWGHASFAFAANMAQSFKQHGWTVNIRGPKSGGLVENLPLHQYDAGRGLQTKIPSETIISETQELQFAELGFIPLSYYKNSDYACFFSANSTQKPAIYSTHEATANARINARLPYVFLASRIAHYLKVLQRENIGTVKDAKVLERDLNTWLQTLVTTMNDPSDELTAKHPLREGLVQVMNIKENPGYFRVQMYIKPHFQIEGMDLRLSLVSQLPAALEG